ncbi:hypothetical protein ACI48D_11615 [Massilia sp. LXY-6]|uniref:hypothetical protein n=1 Tax=Massilia sp. LXY-6 TaxID=3379823 RepID=UPI003EE3810B
MNYEDGRALLVIKLAGMPFESLPDTDIKMRFDSLNRVIAALGKLNRPGFDGGSNS